MLFLSLFFLLIFWSAIQIVGFFCCYCDNSYIHFFPSLKYNVAHTQKKNKKEERHSISSIFRNSITDTHNSPFNCSEKNRVKKNVNRQFNRITWLNANNDRTALNNTWVRICAHLNGRLLIWKERKNTTSRVNDPTLESLTGFFLNVRCILICDICWHAIVVAIWSLINWLKIELIAHRIIITTNSHKHNMP